MSQIGIFLTSMHVGGAQRIALNLSKGLVKKGHTVDLLLVESDGALLDELPERVTVVDLDSSRVATSIWPLQRYLSKRDPDVLYSMMIEINIAAVAAHQLANTTSRLVISEHNTPTISANGLKDLFLLRLAAYTYPQADHVVTVSNGVREDLLEVVELACENVTVIYNPIDVARIRAEAKELINHEWLNDPTTPVVISAGRHAPQKGFDTLLRAFADLKNDDARLLLLGEGEETKSLKTLANELNIDSDVDFLGFVDNPFKYMANADVFVLSSWYEGFGNVLIEAMAAGCPVVSTECPSGPNEILKGGTYGPLVPVKDPSAMSNAIEDILNEPTDKSLLSARADYFSIENIIKNYEEVFF